MFKNNIMALNLQDIFASTYFFAILVVFVTMYGPRLSPKLPDPIRRLFNSHAFRALVMFLVIYSSNRQLGLVMSLTIVIVFMVLMNILQTSTLLESFQQENFEVSPYNIDVQVGGPSPISCGTYDMKQADFLGTPFYPLNDRNNLGGTPMYSPDINYTDIIMDTQNAAATAVVENEAQMLRQVQKYKTMF